MFDETKAPYFKDLPVWLQESIKAKRNKEIECERERDKTRERVILSKCNARGYGLDPTRGVMAYPPVRRSRRSVGDYSILEE